MEQVLSMRVKKLLIFCCLFLFQEFNCKEKFNEDIYIVLDVDFSIKTPDVAVLTSGDFFLSLRNRPTPLLRFFHLKQKQNKKLTAAILAFPLPFGIVGLHRIYLGSAPYVPVVYIASFGGALGLLPLIDFCFILADKKIENYTNNKKVFMWVK